MALALDLTGSLAANKVINESHNVSLEINRFIVPNEGGFYSRDLIVRNVATGEPLRPVADYSLYEPVEEIWKRLGVGVYKIIHIHNPLIAAVRIDYQAIGGDYQYTAQQLEAEVGSLLAGGSSTYPFGHVSGMPLGGLPPELHFEDARETYDAGKLVLAINHIADAINSGDRLALSQIYQYVGDYADDYHRAALEAIAGLSTRVDNLKDILDEGIGDIIISDNPTPPHIRRGYGLFQLSPDVLLIGQNASSTVGDLVGLAAGSDYFARRTHIWRQVEDLGQVTYELSTSTNNVNEGDSVTFTLQTTGISAGTNVPYRITGSAGFTANDITGTPLSGFFTIDADGRGTRTILATADDTSEGVEDFTLTITATTNVSRTVTLNDTSKSPSIALRFSADPTGVGTITQADEGTTAYLVITSTNMPNGHVLNVNYAGGSAQPDNFDQERPSNIILTGVTTIVPYAIKADRKTGGNRTLVPSISSTIVTLPVATSLVLRDTSKEPTYQMWFSRDAIGTTVATSMDEGQRIYLHIQTTEVDVGATFDLQYTGNAANDDFSEVRPITVSVGIGGKAVVEYMTVNDYKSEGNESFGVNLIKDGAILRSTNILILDTSANANYAMAFYSDSAGMTTREVANEGDTVYLVLKTQNVPAGTQVTVETNPANTTATAADFTTAIPTKLTIGSDGKGIAALTIRNDYLGEGVETLQLIAKDANAVQIGTATLVINDTSVNSSAIASWSSSTSGTPVIAQTNEGTTIYLHFAGTNMPPSAKIDLIYPLAAGTVGPDDFATTRPSNVTLNASGRGYVGYTLKNDMLREGDEVFQVEAYYEGTQLGNYAITIKDTSIPTIDAKTTAAVDGTGTISNVNEGVQFYLFLQGQGYPVGQVLKIEHSGVALVDFEVAPAAVVQLDSNFKVAVPIKLKNNMKTDGSRTMTILIRDANDLLLRTVNITINDTSKLPTYSMVWSTSPSGVPAITNASLGDVAPIYLVVNTTNVPDGTELKLHRKGTDYNPNDYASAVNEIETIIVNQNRAVLEVSTRSRTDNISVGFVDELGIPVSGVNEGEDVYLSINTIWTGPSDESIWNVGGAMKFYMRLKAGDGYATAADLTTILPTYITWGGGVGESSPRTDQLKIRVKLDSLIEGTEKLAIEINERSDFSEATAFGTATVDIVDKTSLEQVVSINTWPSNERLDLMKAYTAAYGAPTAAVNARFVIAQTVTITGNGGSAIVDGGGWPTGSALYVENRGKCYGSGGQGSRSIMEPYDHWGSGILDALRRTVAIPPQDGYSCVSNTMSNGVQIYVTNYGTMMSGGGGGGRGEDFLVDGVTYTNADVPMATNFGGEGGGAGYGGAAGNWDAQGYAYDYLSYADGYDAASGVGGLGGRHRYRDFGGILTDQPVIFRIKRMSDNQEMWSASGFGGKGGDAGKDGSPGYQGEASTMLVEPAGNLRVSNLSSSAGARAGYLTSGAVTFTNQGGVVRSRDYQ